MNLQADATPVVFVNVSDRERGLGFYRDTLGLPVRGSDAFGDFLEFSGALLRMTALPDYKAAPHPVLGWNVSDIAAAVRALRVRGVTFIVHEGFGQDELGIWTSPDGAARLAWFADPYGNLLTLSQA